MDAGQNEILIRSQRNGSQHCLGGVNGRRWSQSASCLDRHDRARDPAGNLAASQGKAWTGCHQTHRNIQANIQRFRIGYIFPSATHIST
jgi:hypothetical protein